MKKIVLAAFAGLFLAGAASAQTKPADKPIPGAIQMAIGGGLKLEKTFAAPGNMTGWVLSQGVDSNIVVYTTADGEAAIAGNMLDAKGKNLTKQHLEQYAPKVDYDKMWGELEQSTFVAEGPKDAKTTIYVFKDANCGYCHLAWKAFQPYVKAGLQVRWIPVAFLAPDSGAKAAVLMTAKDPAAAIRDLHENFARKTTLPPVSADIKAKLDANEKLMKAWGFKGTPALFYKDKNGKVQAVSGMPRLSELPAITGLPQQVINDPDLARYN
jgi:thiol:disulfide interchange protein DsbG